MHCDNKLFSQMRPPLATHREAVGVHNGPLSALYILAQNEIYSNQSSTHPHHGILAYQFYTQRIS